MAEEDGELVHWLEREYALAFGEMTWNDDGYMAWAQRRYVEGHYVDIFVWRNLFPSVPHHRLRLTERIKAQRQTLIRRRVIHCESREKASRLEEMLRASWTPVMSGRLRSSWTTSVSGTRGVSRRFLGRGGA